MKILLLVIRWVVGLLFIFSGLVKANDPLGLAYKMQEFFEVWGLHGLQDYTLWFSLLMNTFEVVAGVAVIVGWRMKLFSWLLLILIVFFTFLTGYAVLSGKIKTCGCFGDCIPLTPQTSFIKDILLFICIVILLFTQKKVKANIHPALGISVLLLATFLVGYGQKHVLTHLPIIDCLPYKQGNDIKEKMASPKGAIADSVSIMMEFEKGGQKYFFDANNFPSDFDSTYVYIDRKEVLVSKGNGLKAGIGDFTLTTISGLDTTKNIFITPIPYVLVFAGYVDSSIAWNEMILKLREKYKLIYIVTADKAGAIKSLPGVNVLIGDITMIKTAARVWPTIFVMNGSTIMQKITYQDYIKK